METKVPFYNIVNIFLPGLVFIGSCILLFLNETKILVDSVASLDSVGLEVLITVSCFAIAYEIGYIIFRLGAALIEPILRMLFDWAPYDRFVAAKKAGAEKSLEMLSREYGYARTQITLFVLLSILIGIRMHWILLGVCVLCVVLFTMTARGHIKKTITTVDKFLTGENKCKVEGNG